MRAVVSVLAAGLLEPMQYVPDVLSHRSHECRRATTGYGIIRDMQRLQSDHAAARAPYRRSGLSGRKAELCLSLSERTSCVFPKPA